MSKAQGRAQSLASPCSLGRAERIMRMLPADSRQYSAAARAPVSGSAISARDEARIAWDDIITCHNTSTDKLKGLGTGPGSTVSTQYISAG